MPESARRRALIDVHKQAELAGFGEIMSPIFEDLGVFKRLGESTDVVTKEMFDFFDKGERCSTAPCDPSSRRRYVGPLPNIDQARPGRSGTKDPSSVTNNRKRGATGSSRRSRSKRSTDYDPQADIDVIALGLAVPSLGLREITLLLNSLGDPDLSTGVHGSSAVASQRARQFAVRPEPGNLERNPLRVLDSKRDEDAAVIAAAPLMVDFLTDDTREHFETVRSGLDQLGIPYQLSRLVRGLDYYTRTTFEFAADALATAQNAVGGGGRYDGLVEDLGGPPRDRVCARCRSHPAAMPRCLRSPGTPREGLRGRRHRRNACPRVCSTPPVAGADHALTADAR